MYCSIALRFFPKRLEHLIYDREISGFGLTCGKWQSSKEIPLKQALEIPTSLQGEIYFGGKHPPQHSGLARKNTERPENREDEPIIAALGLGALLANSTTILHS